MRATVPPALPQDAGALIDHILTENHERDRAQLAALLLAERVEQDHADDPGAPPGLARALVTLAQETAENMAREEIVLFPVMRMGDGPGVAHPIAVMRADHDGHAAAIARTRRLTKDLTAPEHTCGSWRALYAGTTTLLVGPHTRIAMENNMPFPCFEPAA